MGKIVKMTPELSNMIAAGEVVERPSSVVKELLENSIDAHSKNIKIYLLNGGLDEIKIIDDGDGMDKDDVEMSFIPHATSKIKNAYDLARLHTLGFRGEAIASISMVSKMEITSSADGVSGYQVLYKAGVRKKGELVNSNKGTTITVNELFLNTPARLKYMKSAKQELSSILYYIERLSIAHPDIRFSVYSDNRLVFQTSGSNKMNKLLYELYGLDASKNYMDFSYVSDGYNAHLVMLKPVIYRSNKLEITLVINGRFVKNYNIINSIVEAYDTFLPIGKSPVGIFYLEIDPLLVDCNIHPNKVEIKISNENEICNLVKEKIREELKKETLIPERKIDTNIGYKNTTIFENMPSEVIKEPEFKYEPSISSDVEINQEEKIIEKPVERPIEAIKEETLEPKRKLPILEYVGSIFGTYLIFQNSEGMYLIDQHAAAERVNYEKYLKILSNPNQPTTDLLVPIIVSFSKSEALFLENNLDAFNNIGFKLEQIGDLDFAIRMIPLWAKIDNLESIIYDILSKMIDEKKVDVIYFRDHIAKQISCKASIKANHTISRVEVDALISNLNKCDNPFTCPHGRPTIIKIDINELERKFERIQR